jgi:DNA polymerase-3 subunit alpha (Gram-positive type)
MEQCMQKQLKEIFKDFNFNSYILNSKIQCINLYKKTNKLEIKIKVDRSISIKDISAFEKYLIKRFFLKDVNVIVEYENGIEVDFISEWENILDYLSYKHPLTKALLKNSKLEVQENKININLPFTGSDILKTQGMDEILSDIIFRTYSKKYKINYFDNISEDSKKAYQETTKKMQDNLIMEFKNKTDTLNEKGESGSKNKESKNQNQSKNKDKDEEQKNQNVNQTSEANITKNEPTQEAEEEITPLILGRNQNIKDPLVKVIDVSIDSGKICLEGEIINTDSRELKSGKFLFMFDLYDGTSTITCKAFIEKEKFKQVTRKN